MNNRFYYISNNFLSNHRLKENSESLTLPGIISIKLIADCSNNFNKSLNQLISIIKQKR